MMSAISEIKVAELYESENLLREFEALVDPASVEPQIVPQIKHLLDEFDDQQNIWREEQKSLADNFNILRAMRLTRKELCHSDILA